MCTVCGCSERTPSIERADAQSAQTQGHHHDHAHDHYGHHRDHVHSGQNVHDSHHHHHGHYHHHGHSHQHAQGGGALVDCGADPAGLKIAGMSSERTIRIERDILGKNNRIAADNRARFLTDDLLVFNLVSSPGAGKTSLLVRAVSELKDSRPVGVIEGDQQTSNDADRIRATGVPAIQINTGKGCHLDAAMVGEAYRRLPPLKGGILFIENVGNLVCPAAFDLGEACKIVVFSTADGEDKPLKYPYMFAASSLMLINKIDLAPVVDFDSAKTIEYARCVNPNIEVLTVSARTGEGFAALYAWIWKQAANQRRPVGDALP
ncbi:hydrogenase nickel incorporation protein HypB [Bradyrhizobium sp. CSA112]|uniref:hydrogenase nickel incorporation protein HypB n=1 Tax=Bradyrhizobium sp. CSA112 TaxID=2699170 RepID=UPI0023B1BBBE|nr:hydrogenase nickel incorporation protein HypB [Bradyrhizobium sp. CSA112]MDE5458224.1 hydrogenase nickel incorporation protein HypB [Bradyrhizobium sp. CSA112]